MGFSLGDMFLSALLFTNAAAILHEKRFLNQCACARACTSSCHARPPAATQGRLGEGRP
jgi:hypothetical protein